jgi:hypothetical protein
MATPVAESRANANFIQAGQGTWPLPSTLNGRVTGYKLYNLEYDTLIVRVKNLETVIRAIAPNSMYRRKDHDDRDGNLPYAPHPKNPVAEFHVEDNGLPFPSHLRVVYDAWRRNIYITPTHYDPWTDARGTNRNPFYLLIHAPLLADASFK